MLLRSTSFPVFFFLAFLALPLVAQNGSILPDTNWRMNIAPMVTTDWNRGDISHPLEIIRGRTAGLHITHPGGNPFEPYIIRSRGQNTLHTGNTIPRVLLDDMPVENLRHYHIFNILSASTEVSAAENAIHGLMRMQGNINFTTNSKIKNTLVVKYGNIFSSIGVTRQTPILNDKEFIQLGGIDLGDGNNFQKLIQQKGYEQQHNLSIAGRWQNTQLELSGNLLNRKPILKNTNSDNLYARIAVSQSFWKDRIHLKWNHYQYRGEHNYGVPEAFRYANNFNPTSPVYDNTATQYGGYYQQTFFNYYNPVSLVDQVHRFARENGTLNQVSGAITAFPSLKIGINYSRETSEENRRNWMPTTSFFSPYPGGGFMEKIKDNLLNEWLDLFAAQHLSFGHFEWSGRSGYSIQMIRRNSNEFSGYGFPEEITENTDPALGSTQSSTFFGEAHNYIRFYSTHQLLYKNLLSVDFTANYNGSSRLGKNNRWGLFYGVSTDLNLNQLFDLESNNSFGFNFNIGKVGNIPMADNLSEYIIDQQYGKFYYQGDFVNYASYRHDRNPHLSWENKSEWGFGFQKGLWKNQLILHYRVFYNHSADLIDRIWISRGISESSIQWQNLYGINNRGWEISLEGKVLSTEKLDWTLSLNAFRFRSKLIESPEYEQNIGSRCGCGRPFAPYYIIRGEELGQLRVWKETYNGQQYVEVDQGNNGLDLNDYQVVGSIYPKLIFGFQNELKTGKLRISLRATSALGHRVVNENRLVHEKRDLTLNQNIVKTRYFINQPNFYNVFSERFAEKASYLSIDQLFLSYDLSALTGSFLSGFSLIAGSNNLLTISKYAGLDPEVRYQEIFPEKGYRDLEYSALSGGFESQQTYPATRSFFVGFQVNFSK